LPSRSLPGSANDVAALHERAKQNPGKRFDDGVALIRQAVAILQRILPTGRLTAYRTPRPSLARL